MKKEFENLFSSKPLNMSVYEQIIFILNTLDDEIGIKIREIANNEGFGILMDCLVAILLDKDKKKYWDKVFYAIWSSYLIFDFLITHPNKDKLTAIIWYCIEINPTESSLGSAIGNRLKDPRDCIEKLDPYQYESYSRNHPDIVKEIKKLKYLYG